MFISSLIWCLSDINIDSLKLFCKEVLKTLYIEALICGNLTHDNALEIIKVVEDVFVEQNKARRLFPIQHMKHREYQLPQGELVK